MSNFSIIWDGNVTIDASNRLDLSELHQNLLKKNQSCYILHKYDNVTIIFLFNMRAI